ncbi:unnamed protein product [Sphagnum troendelagicum]|uniref:Uncharacterized protein n=1 Tax=Sphagnum troendelagicum TaxID=128251 RepID=A0ABP0V4R9_9BRYO
MRSSSMSCNGTDHEEELCPFLPAIANAGSLPSPVNTAAALDSPSPVNAAAALDAPSPANANAGPWDSATADVISPANVKAAAAVAADVSPSPGNVAALDARLLANANAVLSIAAGLDLSSSANAAAWDLASSEAGVDLVEVQNCQALGGYEVLGSTRWTKVRHHRVYFIWSILCAYNNFQCARFLSLCSPDSKTRK